MNGLTNNSRIRDLSKNYTHNQSTICGADKSNPIICIEESDDSDINLQKTIPKITIQLRQSTSFLHVESIKSSVASGSWNKHLSPNGKKCLTTRSKLKSSECSESETAHTLDHGEIVEIDSLSSLNANTRLKSNESSSEIQVSHSSVQDKSTQLWHKNIIPADNFEKYLYSISKTHKEHTWHDKVVSWQCSDDLSDVEDYTHFEERLRKHKINYDFKKTGRDVGDNNNREASLKTTDSKHDLTKSKCFSRRSVISDNLPDNSRKSENNTDDFTVAATEGFLMSINTKTMEFCTSDTILLNSDPNSADRTFDLVRPDTNDACFQHCHRNSEIDKISQLIHSRLLKQRKIETQQNFKIPIVSKSGKMDLKQKEEFYKYLGLETNNFNQHNNKSTMKSKLLANDGKDSCFNEQRENQAERAPLKEQQMLSCMPQFKKKNEKINSELGIHNTTDFKSSQMVANVRRNCGTVIKKELTACSNKIRKSNNANQYYSTMKMVRTKKVKPYESNNTMIMLKYTYKKPLCQNTLDEPTIVQHSCQNMALSQSEEVNNINNSTDNVKKKLPSTNRIRRLNSYKNNLLSLEKNFSPFMTDFAMNYKTIQHYLKTNAVRNPSCILEKLDYNRQHTKRDSAATSSVTCSNGFGHIKEDTTGSISHPKVKMRRKLISANRHRILKKSQHVKILRSSILNRRILRNGKYFIISAKTLNKRKRSQILRKRKRVQSEISENILSIARTALKDPVANDVVVMTPELRLEEKNSTMEEDKPNDNNTDITKVEYASHNLPPNPLQSEKGRVLHAFYVQDILIVVQELFVSFWKYSKVVQMLGKAQEWEHLGECKRRLNDFEVLALYKNRICLNDTNPVYIEMRGKFIEANCARECNLSSVYINLYYFDEWKVSPVTYSVQLDTVRGLVSDITFTTITNSRYFVMCWKHESPQGGIRTGICKYALTPTLDTLASIREFKQMRHVIHSLECINDYKLIGFGETQVSIWDHRTGDVLTNFDLGLNLGRNVGSVISSIQFKSYLFLYQTRYVENSKTPELKILAITLSESNPSFRLICTHKLPPPFAAIRSSVYTEKQVITTAVSGEEFLLLTHQPHCLYYFNSPLSRKFTRFHANGSESFVQISEDMLIVTSLDEYLMNFAR